MSGGKRTINPKAKAAGAKVIKFAKQYQKEHPNTPWKSCMKHGGQMYRADKK
jgi:hypothetical protein